jgi:hypothetical protein
MERRMVRIFFQKFVVFACKLFDRIGENFKTCPEIQ